MRPGDFVVDNKGRTFELLSASTITDRKMLIERLNDSLADMGDQINIPIVMTNPLVMGNIRLIRIS